MYTQRFKNKVIISGVNVESYTYEKLILKNYKRHKRKVKKKDDDILKNEKKKNLIFLSIELEQELEDLLILTLILENF